MENTLNNARVVKLRSCHTKKHLLAVDDQKSVIQGKNVSTNNDEWTVEREPGSDHLIRLKSRHGKYLTASDEPSLLGITGFYVHQTLPGNLDSSIQWEPIEVRNQVVKLKNSRRDTFLRAGNRSPPQPYAVTHKVPLRSSANNYEWHLVIVATTEQHSSSTPEMEPNQRVPEPAPVPAPAPAPASRPGFMETVNPAVNIANFIVGATRLATNFTDSGQGNGDEAGVSDAGNAPMGDTTGVDDAGNAATGDGTGFSDLLGGMFNY